MSVIWSKGIPALFLLCLSGCLSMSNTEKKENLMSSPSLDKSRIEGIESSVFISGSWPDQKWWTSFQSPLLNEWVEVSLTQNPSLLAVQSRIFQAKEIAKVYRANLYPTLYFNGNDNARHLSDTSFNHLLNPSLSLNGYQIDLSFAFNYEFDFWDKNRNLFRAAIGQMKALEAEYQETALILSAAISQAYFDLFISFEKENLYQKLYQVRLAKFNLQEKLRSSALLSKIEPLLGDEGVKQAQQLIESILDEIEVQSHLINVLMGRGPDEYLEKTNILLTPPKCIPLPEDLSTNLLARRPDLMAQIWRAEALAAEVGAAKADFFPNINLAAFAGVVSTAWNTLFKGSSKSAGYNPSFSLPIFTAGSIRANLMAKKASFDQAIFEYNALILQSVQEVTDLLSNVRMIYKQKDLQDDIVKDAKERLDLITLRKKSGLDSEFAILDYTEDLINKQIANLDYTYSQYAFIIKLIKSLGGGYISSEIPISKEEA